MHRGLYINKSFEDYPSCSLKAQVAFLFKVSVPVTKQVLCSGVRTMVQPVALSHHQPSSLCCRTQVQGAGDQSVNAWFVPRYPAPG